MEGNIYLCKKKKLMGFYSLELIDNPSIKSKGISLEECKEDICMQIIDWNGDGEAVLEFLPEKSKKTVTGIEMYRSVEYNDSTVVLNINNLYNGGICNKCKYSIGERTDEKLNLAHIPKKKKVIIGVSRRESKGGNDFSRLFPDITVYHKDFVSLLSREEMGMFESREVLYKGTISDYLELIPITTIKNTGHKGADYYKHKFLKTWRCSECGREELHFWTKEYGWNNELVNSYEISSFPTIFFFDTGLHISLAIRNDRWLEMNHNEKIKVTTSPIVVLESKYAEYPEHFYEPEKFEW